MQETIKNVVQWAADKNLLKKENSLAQMAKVTEEVGEVASALLKKDTPKLIDGIGDVVVTLIILAEQNQLRIEDCLEADWIEISNSKGKTIDGTFIKEAQMKITVTYMAFNQIFEDDFKIDITLEQVHKYLYDKCSTYVITDIRII